MSVRVMSQVWDVELPAFEKLVLLALADCANDEGLAWPSIATLTRKSGASERTVQRAIQAVEAAGHLRREQVPGKGCKYHLHPRQCDTPRVARKTDVQRKPVSANPRQADTPVNVTPPSVSHPTPVSVTPHPRHSDTQSVIEPSMNLKSPSDSSSGGVDAGQPVFLPALIEQPDATQLAFDRHDAVRREFVPNARMVELSPERRRDLSARLREVGGLAGWDEILATIRASPFLRGDTSRTGFVPKLDWLLKPANLRKVREGNYDHDEKHQRNDRGRASLPRSPIDAIGSAWVGRSSD